MSNDLKVEKPKEFRINPEELSELSFDVQNLKAKQIEVDMWNVVIQNLQNKITQRLSLNKNDVELDWSHIFPDGIILVRKKVVPKVEVKPVEVKKNDDNSAKATIG
jgi:hypothetical protein